MICCISPVWSDCDESNNSLKYANRARNIRNKPVLNRDKNSLRMEKMQNEIELLREQLTRHVSCSSNLGADAGGKLKDVGRYEMMLLRAQEASVFYSQIHKKSLMKWIKKWKVASRVVSRYFEMSYESWSYMAVG